MHTNKQNNNMLKSSQTILKQIYSTQKKNDKTKQTNKQNSKNKNKNKKLEKLEGKKNLCCWMKLVSVAPSSSTCTRK